MEMVERWAKIMINASLFSFLRLIHSLNFYNKSHVHSTLGIWILAKDSLLHAFSMYAEAKHIHAYINIHTYKQKYIHFYITAIRDRTLFIKDIIHFIAFPLWRLLEYTRNLVTIFLSFLYIVPVVFIEIEIFPLILLSRHLWQLF